MTKSAQSQCLYCSTPFKPRSRNHKYCSSFCQSKHHHFRVGDAGTIRKRFQMIEFHYGIDMLDWFSLFFGQGCKCAICGKPFPQDGSATRSIHTDHCHDTGRVRGLLCKDCNNGLGNFKDNPDRLRDAASYLDKHSERPPVLRDSLPILYE